MYPPIVTDEQFIAEVKNLNVGETTPSRSYTGYTVTRTEDEWIVNCEDSSEGAPQHYKQTSIDAEELARNIIRWT